MAPVFSHGAFLSKSEMKSGGGSEVMFVPLDFIFLELTTSAPRKP